MADGSTTQRTYTVGFPFGGIGLGALGFQAAGQRVFSTEMRFRSVGGIDLDKVAAKQFERFTKSPCLVADVHTLTAEQLREFWPTAPDVIFTSPPCKGFSQLTSKKARASEKYRVMNRLALDWINLQIAAWGDQGPRLVLLENVPGIATAGRPLLREIEKALRAAGYVIHESAHDCGELGGLAQHRRRFLLVARHSKRCSALLYQPRKRPLRAVGEVLSTLPLPGDPGAGPLHRLPKISSLNWIRLALIPPGGDWRDIPGVIPAGLTRNQVFRRYRTLGWGETAPTVTGGGGNAVSGIEDPRITADNPSRHTNKFRVSAWRSPAGTVTGGDSRVGSGAPLVEDPRVPTAYPHCYGVLGWGSAAHTVAGMSAVGCGAYSVADPRASARYGMNQRVGAWAAPAWTVTGATDIQAGAPAVEDPRVPSAMPQSYGLLAWSAPTGTVTGRAALTTGAFSVADPRVSSAHHGSYGVSAWTTPAGVVTGGAAVSTGAFSVVDPRLTCRGRNGYYGVTPWSATSTTITGSLQIDNGPAAVSDPRIPGNPPLCIAWFPRDLRSSAPFPLVLPSVSGHWHRPLTTLELLALQGGPMVVDGAPVQPWGSDALVREHIGNGVPVGAAQRIAEQMLFTLGGSDIGAGLFASGAGGVWVRERQIAGHA